MRVRKSAEVFITSWGLFSLVSVTFLSNQNLIDGISYFKVALAVAMIIPVFPILAYKLICFGKTYFVFLALAALSFIIVLALSDGQNNYRDLFGAPGRSNGIVSFVNFIAFLFFGAYISLVSKARNFVNTLTLVSSSLSLTILISSQFDLFKGTVLASWNFNNPDFQENTNLIAPLIVMGIFATTQDIKLGKVKLAILKLLPQITLLIKFGLLQSLMASIAGLIVYWLFNKKQNVKPILIPIILIQIYILGLAITSFSIFQSDPSVKERRDIILFQEVYKDFTILPKNIDALSDFSNTFNSSQILDDFHNVPIQLLFSLGILGGSFFLYLIFKSYSAIEVNSDLSISLLSIHSTLFVSLLVGIVSPNYIYFGATLIGIMLFQSNGSSTRRGKFSRRDIPVLGLVFLMSISMLAIQVEDYMARSEISKLTLLSNYEKGDLDRLVQSAVVIQDSGIRYLIARNLFSIGDCRRGRQILRQMIETNQNEVRIEKLYSLEKSCNTT
jgi:hypothetical protein